MLKRLSRTPLWWLLTLLALGAVAWIRPEQLEVVVYKLALVFLAGVLALHFDRAVCPYARPEDLMDKGEERLCLAAMLRRAIIIAGAMLAMAMGL